MVKAAEDITKVIFYMQEELRHAQMTWFDATDHFYHVHAKWLQHWCADHLERMRVMRFLKQTGFSTHNEVWQRAPRRVRMSDSHPGIAAGNVWIQPGEHPIHIAAKVGHAAVVETLLSIGVGVDEKQSPDRSG